MRRVLAALAAITALLIPYILFGTSRKASSPAGAKENSRLYVSAEGKVEARPGRSIRVAAEIVGRIASLKLQEGDQVEAGQVIAIFDDREMRAQLSEAKSELSVAEARLAEISAAARPEELSKAKAASEHARAALDHSADEFRRYEELRRRGVVAQSAFEEKRNRYEIALADRDQALGDQHLVENGARKESIEFHKRAVEQAQFHMRLIEARLAKYQIASPISGTVVKKYVHEGEVVFSEPPTPLLDIVDTNSLLVNAEIDETDIGRVTIGSTVEIQSGAFRNRTFAGRVARIADFAGERGFTPNNQARIQDMKTIQIKIEFLEHTPLKLGMTVDVRIRDNGESYAESTPATRPTIVIGD
jgi:multidrug resistance efflux pump